MAKPKLIQFVGYNLYITQKEGKFGLRDPQQGVDLLEVEYDELYLYPGTSHLFVEKATEKGIFDVQLRLWLVPLHFTQIYRSREPLQFVVYQNTRRGLYDGARDKISWC